MVNVAALLLPVLSLLFETDDDGLALFWFASATVAVGAITGLGFAFTLHLKGHRESAVLCAGLALTPWFVILVASGMLEWIVGWFG